MVTDQEFSLQRSAPGCQLTVQGAKPGLTSNLPDSNLPGHRSDHAIVKAPPAHGTAKSNGPCRAARPSPTPAEVPGNGSPSGAADAASPCCNDQAGVPGSNPPLPIPGGHNTPVYTRTSLRRSARNQVPKSSQGSSEKPVEPSKVAHVVVTAVGQAEDLPQAHLKAGHDRTADGAASPGEDPPQGQISANADRLPPAEHPQAATDVVQLLSEPGQLASVAVNVAAAGEPIPAAVTPAPAACMNHNGSSGGGGQMSPASSCHKAAADPASHGSLPAEDGAAKAKQGSGGPASASSEKPPSMAAAHAAPRGSRPTKDDAAKDKHRTAGHILPPPDDLQAAADASPCGSGLTKNDVAKDKQETAGRVSPPPDDLQAVADAAPYSLESNGDAAAKAKQETAGQVSPALIAPEAAADPATHGSGSAKAAASKKKRRRSSGRFQDTQTDYVSIPASAKRQKPEVLTRRQEEVAARQRQGARLHHEISEY